MAKRFSSISIAARKVRFSFGQIYTSILNPYLNSLTHMYTFGCAGRVDSQVIKPILIRTTAHTHTCTDVYWDRGGTVRYLHDK